MLGAAHVLAMDSKNLLDVVDAIRTRYPHTNKQFQKLQETTEGAQPEQVFPTPVTCTFMQMYPQNVQTTASSSVSTNQVGDS